MTARQRRAAPTAAGEWAGRSGRLRSEVRDSVVNDLLRRVERRAYRDYLIGMRIHRLRAFQDQEISFDFPVTALIGPNGGGKTTILNAAALLYGSVPTGRIFTRSGIYDVNMRDWHVEYELKDARHKEPWRHTATYAERKWSRGRVRLDDRAVRIFGVERTVPASERRNLARYAGYPSLPATEIPIDPSVTADVGRILGKRTGGYLLQRFVGSDVSLLVARSDGGDTYSEFQFGAGEASVVRMVHEMAEAPRGALILIEEIENGLHPLAVCGLVDHLIMVAKRQECQIIFTTHSNDALDPLPSSAVWSAYDGQLRQGRLDVRTMRTLTGASDTKLVVFVEDRFAAEMVYTALRTWAGGSVHLPSIEVLAQGGFSSALAAHRHHADNPGIAFPSVLIADGDKRAEVADVRFAVSLPGHLHPEEHVFQAVMDGLSARLDRLTAMLLLPGQERDSVRRALELVQATYRDPHLIFEKIGEELHSLGGDRVMQAFLAMWAQDNPREVDDIVSPLSARLPVS